MFETPVDVANRCLQHLGVPRITAFSDSSKQAQETGFVYDKIRRSLLRRSVWGFATNRAILRPIISTTKAMTIPVWAIGTTYATGDIVLDPSGNGYPWIAIAGSTGQTPGSVGAGSAWTTYFGSALNQLWVTGTAFAYIPGDVVYLSGGTQPYICNVANNSTTPPNTSYWHAVQGGNVALLTQLSPLGYNPSGTVQRTIYQLPMNFLRIAPQDPKQPSVTRYGVTAGMLYNDWEIEAGNIYSTLSTGPIVFRFVADVSQVYGMEDLFCEVWACQMAIELCEIMTQSQEKLAMLIPMQTRYLDMAKLTNAIEGGSTEAEIPEGGAAPQEGGGGQGGRR